MIVGISQNIDDERYDVYLDHINNVLLPCEVETIYLLGPEKNKRFMKEIAKRNEQEFNLIFERNYRTRMLGIDGIEFRVENCLIVIRSKKIERYI